MQPRVLVTVFTPTFNRERTLGRVWRSLCEQTFRDFEWLIIDDGSTDGTSECVQAWLATSTFPVRYYRKRNGGKHTAHNKALELANGYFCATLDSDDWYAPTALEDLISSWNSIPQEDAVNFANVEGLTQTANGALVGSPFPKDVFDSNNFAMPRARLVNGDTRGMYRTDVLRRYPFPSTFDGQFVPESIVWNRIAKRYNSRYINKVIGFTEYLPGGLSDSGIKVMLASIEPRLLYYKELLEAGQPLSVREKLRAYANYLRLSLHKKDLIPGLGSALPSRTAALALLPIALALFLRDLAKLYFQRR